MTEKRRGILAIFNNVAPGREADFERWFQHEHLAERLAVPGFLLGRRYEATTGRLGFFNYYLADSPEVFTSPAYLARLDTPTPLTHVVMSEVFKDMNRTICRRELHIGSMRGAAAMVARFARTPDRAALKSIIDKTMQSPAVACGEIWIAAGEGAPVSEEERLRGGDNKIAGCLVIETLRLNDAERIAESLTLPGADISTYRLLCEIRPA